MGLYLVERLYKPFTNFENQDYATGRSTVVILRTLMAMFIVFTVVSSAIWATTTVVARRGSPSRVVYICTRDLTRIDFLIAVGTIVFQLLFQWTVLVMFVLSWKNIIDMIVRLAASVEVCYVSLLV